MNAAHRSITAVAVIGLITLTSAARATLIGNNPNEAGGWDAGSDGHQVLAIQLQNPITEVGSLTSFSFFTGMTPGGFTPPFAFAALVLRPTGTLNEYTVIYDSGNLDAASYPDNAVYTEFIGLPIAVEPGDVIASWGRGIAFDNPTVGEDTWFYNGSEFSTLKPIGTFTAPGGSYSLGGLGTREYALAFEFMPVPEPSTLALVGLGVIGLAIRRRRRRTVP